MHAAGEVGVAVALALGVTVGGRRCIGGSRLGFFARLRLRWRLRPRSTGLSACSSPMAARKNRRRLTLPVTAPVRRRRAGGRPVIDPGDAVRAQKAAAMTDLESHHQRRNLAMVSPIAVPVAAGGLLRARCAASISRALSFSALMTAIPRRHHRCAVWPRRPATLPVRGRWRQSRRA